MYVCTFNGNFPNNVALTMKLFNSYLISMPVPVAARSKA